MFKVGDVVRTKTGTYATHGYGTNQYPPDHTEVEVTTPTNGWGVCEVSWTNNTITPPITKIVAVWSNDLEYIPDPVLPVGQANRSLAQELQDAWADMVEDQTPKECDCGGLKIHKSLAPMFHSQWCSSQQ